MNTVTMLKEIQARQVPATRTQAFELAKVALKEFSKRTKAAKAVDSAVWDMCLADGCPGSVVLAVELLVARCVVANCKIKSNFQLKTGN